MLVEGFLILNAIDLMTTGIALTGGAREAGAIMAPLNITTLVPILLWKLGTCAATLAILMAAGRLKWLRFVNLGLLAVCISNTAVLLRY